ANLRIYEDDEEYVDITETGWYKEIKAQTTPGDAIRVYRENFGLTQAQLGERLGGLPRQTISGMERGKRSVSLAKAKKTCRHLPGAGQPFSGYMTLKAVRIKPPYPGIPGVNLLSSLPHEVVSMQIAPAGGHAD
ncbi:MAG: helix-turn-helix transcriptional regulator, partial [Deltaproteobacteria bacterium]|nr:helix-turn-helix transcriptional regulator [Deltaproteobacteria bacterium]